MPTFSSLFEPVEDVTPQKTTEETTDKGLHFVILTKGFRGDVQPCKLIGQELARRGHRVTLATHEVFHDEILAAGLNFKLIPGDPAPFLRSKEGQAMLAEGEHRAFMTGLQKCCPLAADEMADAARDADVLISATMCLDVAYCLAEAWGKPLLRLQLQPLPPTRDAPPIFITNKSLGGPLNMLSHTVLAYFWCKQLMGPLNDFRKKLGLKSITNALGVGGVMCNETLPFFLATSPTLYPKPSDWGAHMNVTGFIFPPHVARDQGGYDIPAGLEAFLANGDKPVYFGFGSMPSPPEKLLKLVVDTVTLLGCRAVVCAGWTKFDTPPKLPESVFLCAGAPHAWLFPRCAAVVHHGGAGTTAAGVRAGVPAVICPLFADQPFWARQLHVQGCASAPIDFLAMDSESLAARLRDAFSPTVQARAAQMGAVVRTEKGLSLLADMMERAVQPGKLAQCIPKGSATSTTSSLSTLFAPDIAAAKTVAKVGGAVGGLASALYFVADALSKL